MGLCGPDSIHFFAVVAIRWAAQRLRPDIAVHVVLENAGSMRGLHRDAILEALGGLTVQGNVMALDTREWAHTPRRRLFISTLPATVSRARPPRRPSPWDRGYALRWDGEGVVMMRSRGMGSEIRASTYQYHPRHLLYRTDSAWHAGDLISVHRRMLALAPAEVRPGLEVIWRGQARRDEASGVTAARWIEQYGEAHGFRTPRPEERARATGRGTYLVALGHSPRRLYDLVGDHFDPDALLLRVVVPMREWLAGGNLPAPAPAIAPRAALRVYAQVRRAVVAAGYPAEPGPFPRDLRAPLILAESAPTAAQGGRDEQ